MRAALYIRVSTEEQARDGLSLPRQKEKLKEYAGAHNMTIVDYYEDAGISARKSYKKRPALMRMLADVQAGKIDVILFIKLDRWFRNVGNYYAVQDILDKNHVTWQATLEDYETRTAAGRLKVNIMLSVAQDEADRTSERIKFVFEGKKARGEALTGSTPYGYVIVNKKFEKDPKTEAVTNALFKKYMSTNSVSQTQTYLIQKFGVVMPYQQIHKILNSPAYYGRYYDTDGICPPYITKEQFDKLQSTRRVITRKSKQNQIYLFTGLIICAECKGHISTKMNQSGRTSHYYCQNHFSRRRPCENNKTISERKIERYLLDSISYKLENYKAAAEKMAGSQPQENYDAQINAKRARLSRLKDLYLNDLMTLDEYKKDHESITAEIQALQEKKKPVPKPDFSRIDQMLSGEWKALYQDLSTEEKREFWHVLIKEIRWFPDRHLEFDLNV